MYALSFDMDIADLKANYGEPYNGAYFEIKQTFHFTGKIRDSSSAWKD